MLDNVIILVLIVLAFVAGKKISDSYNNRIIQELQFQIRKNDISNGLGYVPYTTTTPIGKEFMEKLKTNGRATQALRTNHNYPSQN